MEMFPYLCMAGESTNELRIPITEECEMVGIGDCLHPRFGGIFCGNNNALGGHYGHHARKCTLVVRVVYVCYSNPGVSRFACLVCQGGRRWINVSLDFNHS